MSALKVVASILIIASASSANWYQNPNQWNELHPECCGSMQSPIDIKSTRRIPLKNITFNNWLDQNFYSATNESFETSYGSVKLYNTGNQVGVQFVHNFTVCSDLLNGTYRLDRMNFHWSANSSEGSQHSLQGVRYPIELEMILINMKYSRLLEATEHPDGVLVLGVFMQPSPGLFHAAAIFEYLGDMMHMVAGQAPTKVDLKHPFMMTPHFFLPHRRSSYYMYRGSLTHPPCKEQVQHLVFHSPLFLNHAYFQTFLAELRKIKDSNGEDMQTNRPIQKTNGRDVIFVAEPGEDEAPILEAEETINEK